MFVDNEKGILRDDNGYINIKFQVGNPLKVGINGTTTQEVTNLVMQRLNTFQNSEMKDEFTSFVISELRKVVDILDTRIQSRMERGVFGEKIH